MDLVSIDLWCVHSEVWNEYQMKQDSEVGALERAQKVEEIW
jgi:hypothetical protein